MHSDFELIRISDRPGFHSYFDVFPESPDGKGVVYFSPELSQSPETTPNGVLLYPGRVLAARADGSDPREIGPATRGNRQAGPRQQWLDNDTVAYGTPGADGPRTTRVSISTGSVEELPGAIRMANPAGIGQALTSSHESRANGFATDEEAVFLQDFASGQLRRLFGVEDLLPLHPLRNRIKHPEQLQIKHTKWAPTGDRFFCVFHHEHFLWENREADIRVKSLMVSEADGTGLHYAGEFGTHPFWGPDRRTIYSFGRNEEGIRVMTFHPAEGGPAETRYPGIHANHASLSPDGRFLAMDCFQVPEKGMASVWLADLETGDEIMLARFDAPDTSGVTGTHPHPVWSRDGKHIYFNAAEDNTPYLYKVKPPKA